MMNNCNEYGITISDCTSPASYHVYPIKYLVHVSNSQTPKISCVLGIKAYLVLFKSGDVAGEAISQAGRYHYEVVFSGSA